MSLLPQIGWVRPEARQLQGQQRIKAFTPRPLARARIWGSAAGGRVPSELLARTIRCSPCVYTSDSQSIPRTCCRLCYSYELSFDFRISDIPCGQKYAGLWR